ncbi:hypothetical protein N3K66_008201 [Trichothecium roseum]|uniref:Uncharacterized protein n=1 Tax=Trichothecium roseum TaxID=47278 RepID=A0ACC0UUJ7_9HYPO|nr:hypothetical protein N3K66_008201 [Trichothecium roseum]
MLRSRDTPASFASSAQGLISNNSINSMSPDRARIDAQHPTSPQQPHSPPHQHKAQPQSERHHPAPPASSISEDTASSALAFNTSASPTRQQSPLRKTFTYPDEPEIESPTRNLRRVISTANEQIGRSSMSFTGDRKVATGSRRPPVWARNLENASEGTVAPRNMISTDVTPIRDNAAESGRESTTPKSATAGNGRFGFFSSLTGAKAPLPATACNGDELMNLDIEKALFPAGSESNSFSPAAFKNLQMNAVGLIQKYQSAYQQKSTTLEELRAEKENEMELKEEALMRTQHLKIQLEEMARKAAEQEAIMHSLMEELAQEKKMLVDERQSRVVGPSSSGCSTMSEDLGAEYDQQKRMWRRSDGTAKSIMSDTDGESIEEASVFSRSRSPTIGTTMTDISPSETPSIHVKTPTMPVARLSKAQPQPQLNTFQKLFKMSPAPQTSSCSNCEGQEASVAWDTVHLLKDENKGLKERVGELEDAMEGALDAVLGVGM